MLMVLKLEPELADVVKEADMEIKMHLQADVKKAFLMFASCMR